MDDDPNPLRFVPDRLDFVTEDVRVRRVSNVAADISGQAQNPAAPIGLSLIEVRQKSHATYSRRQRDQQSFTINKGDREGAAQRLAIQAVWIRGDTQLERRAMLVRELPLIHDRRTLPIAAQLLIDLEPAFGQ